ncbi:uncharacterized protein LOC133911262 isoform X2 [Phragmites australis]|uniref:uncharacterized protein LOC133911262 isoform X2 n=1 Tax=Phragmites australis TaxID=29695 RepID=UPI002D76818C|nr:uncharacterized protein LOC133911262 isoform X2 [Phragmites australis]
MGIPSRLPDYKEEEYDDAVFYEDIEAPKFVDLAASDAARPADDASWFCLRVGCDQSHEQVDPDALDRSFFMRVMAARSPNVRLQKAISRRNQSSMLKCPHSAPPKPPRARFARLSTAMEADEKAAAKPKPRTRRICGLRVSPVRTKATRVEVPSARKKALTTPRSKAVRPRQDQFLSVKHQKERVVAAARKGMVIKALFMSTPRKEAGPTPKSKEAVSEACSKLRKLNLACREVPSRYMCQSTNPKTCKKGEEIAAVKSAKRGQESRTNGKKKILGRSVKCANAEPDEWNRIDCDNGAADESSLTEIAISDQESKVVVQDLRVEVDTLRVNNSDDNKENLSSADQLIQEVSNNSHSENTQLENNENVPLKVAKMQNKVNPEQGGKLKKTTNPRPFRLRTGERGVLKEAKPERKQPFAENNSMAVLKNANRVMGRDKPVEKQKKQCTQVAKPALNSIRCDNARLAMTNGKVSRVASSTRTTKTARLERRGRLQ